MVIYDQTTKHKSDLCFTGVFLTFPGQWRWAWRCNILWDVPTWLGTLCGNPWVRWIGRIDDGLSRTLKFHCCSKKCILTWPATPYTISFYVKYISIYIYIYSTCKKIQQENVDSDFPSSYVMQLFCVYTPLMNEWWSQIHAHTVFVGHWSASYALQGYWSRLSPKQKLSSFKSRRFSPPKCYYICHKSKHKAC